MLISFIVSSASKINFGTLLCLLWCRTLTIFEIGEVAVMRGLELIDDGRCVRLPRFGVLFGLGTLTVLRCCNYLICLHFLHLFGFESYDLDIRQPKRVQSTLLKSSLVLNFSLIYTAALPNTSITVSISWQSLI